VSVSDATTRAVIASTLEQHGYLTDPHGAVALHALQQYLQAHPSFKGIFLETAHPVKFPDVVREVTGQEVPVPASVAHLFDKQKRSIAIDASYHAFKDWMMARR
jgi:threonine synthase